MSNSRIEEIKNEIKSLRGDMGVTSIEVDTSADIILDDMEWLVAQAERLQEFHKAMKRQDKVIDDFRNQNKYYKKAMEKLLQAKYNCDGFEFKEVASDIVDEYEGLEGLDEFKI